ncbi:MAG: cysteine hydrolase [Thaumarchaeota archaeon]|nr:cysteine hydrolase [Nitrososphaerota archaeon]
MSAYVSKESDWSFEELVNPAHTALVVVDMQNDFCSEKGYAGRKGSVASVTEMAPRLVNTLLKARDLGILVIFTKAIHSAWDASPAWSRLRGDKLYGQAQENAWGSDWFEEYEELRPLEGEYVVPKRRYSAFKNTDLDVVLKAKGIRTLVFTGTATHGCVESSVRDAFETDYNCVVLRDCTATGDKQIHDHSLKVMSMNFGTVVDSGKVLDAWMNSPQARLRGAQKPLNM